MFNLRNQTSKCETCVLVKKETEDLHENLNKFTKGKENIDLILSNERPSLNNTGLELKFGRSQIKGRRFNETQEMRGFN